MFLNSLFLISGGVMQALQLLAGLSLLISLHEFGHFFFARLFKTRVEKFYLFFDFLFPFSGLLNFSLFKKKVGDTEYGLGWFPLGGYVKIAGMVDESMDKEALALPPQPWEYRSKKAYQRLLIMLGGIIMNVLVAIFLYMIVFGLWGEHFIPMSNVKNGIVVDTLGRSIGLQNGDMIRSIDGKPVERLDEIPIALILHDDNGKIALTRNGRDTTIPIPSGTIGRLIKADRGNIFTPLTHAIVDTIYPGSLAEKLRFRQGDSIVAVNGQSISYNYQFNEYRNANFGKPLAIAFIRDGKMDTINTVIPRDSILGIGWALSSKYYVHLKFNPIQAIGRGSSYTLSRLQLYIAQFKLFKSKEVRVNESVGGFYSMGKMYPADFDWKSFLMLTAFISVALAFMNFLPIPGLDGGYVIFLLFEMLTGKQVSEKVMERATTVGLVILLALMVYINGLDILKIFHVKV